MTAKREAELETENRMLREQVACLEKIVSQIVLAKTAAQPVYVPNGNAPYWYWPSYQVTCVSPGESLTVCAQNSPASGTL